MRLNRTSRLLGMAGVPSTPLAPAWHQRCGCSTSNSNDAPSVSTSEPPKQEMTRARALERWGSTATGRMPTSGGAGDVSWDHQEALDFSLHFAVPRGWNLRTHVRENFIHFDSTPSSPPVEGVQNVHGLSITSFAYHRKVKEPDPTMLLHNFLKRFEKTAADGRVQIYGATDDALATPMAMARGELSDNRGDAARGMDNVSTAVAGEAKIEVPSDAQVSAMKSRLRAVGSSGGAACEVEFQPRALPARKPPAGASAADSSAGAGSPVRKAPERVRGICRAFYAKNARFHYIALFAVPAVEYPLVGDIMANGLAMVQNIRVESDEMGF